MARPLTLEEGNLFKALTEGEYNNFTLVQVEYDGEDTAAIVVVQVNEESGEPTSVVTVTPVAILLTPAMVNNIKNPFEE